MDEEENFLQAREVERGEEYLFNCKWTISIYDRLPIYKNMAPNTKFRLRCYTYWSIYTLFVCMTGFYMLTSSKFNTVNLVSHFFQNLLLVEKQLPHTKQNENLLYPEKCSLWEVDIYKTFVLLHLYFWSRMEKIDFYPLSDYTLDWWWIWGCTDFSPPLETAK